VVRAHGAHDSATCHSLVASSRRPRPSLASTVRVSVREIREKISADDLQYDLVGFVSPRCAPRLSLSLEVHARFPPSGPHLFAMARGGMDGVGSGRVTSCWNRPPVLALSCSLPPPSPYSIIYPFVCSVRHHSLALSHSQTRLQQEAYTRLHYASDRSHTPLHFMVGPGCSDILIRIG
jgi:hypothetical protein